MTSGTTNRVPVKTHLSPGLQLSTISFLKMTSRLLGIDPAGMSEGFSWTLSFCQSEKVESSVDSSHSVLLLQLLFTQIFGSVYLNCCSMCFTNELHTLHLNEPEISSGLTSLLLVMVP